MPFDGPATQIHVTTSPTGQDRRTSAWKLLDGKDDGRCPVSVFGQVIAL